MRGGKSFLVLLVLALGIGAYAYFVESKREPSDTAVPAKGTKVLPIDSSKVEEIEVTSASGDVTRLKKNGNDWQIVAPSPMDADQQTVSALLSSLESLETSKTIDEHPASVKDFGLDPPRAIVGVRQTGETTMRKIDLGTKTPTGADLYARVEGQPKLILIGASADDSLNRSTFDLRDKTVLKFDRDKADSVKLEPAGTPALVLTKKGNDWRLTAPVEAKADFSAVDGLVAKLAQTKMKALVAADAGKDLKKYGLDKPQAVATIGAGSTRATLALGAKADDGSIYARDLSRPMVFSVEATLLDDLKKKTDDVRPKDLFEFRSFSADSIDITHAGETLSFAKQKPAASPAGAAPVPDVWKQTKPAAKDVDQAKLNDLLTNISNLHADRFVDKALALGEEFAVTARYGEPGSLKEEHVTFRKSGDVVHAIRQGEPGAAVVPTADFDKVVAGLKELAGGK
jgi:Domain of unknown function (DUF4340)